MRSCEGMQGFAKGFRIFIVMASDGCFVNKLKLCFCKWAAFFDYHCVILLPHQERIKLGISCLVELLNYLYAHLRYAPQVSKFIYKPVNNSGNGVFRPPESFRGFPTFKARTDILALKAYYI